MTESVLILRSLVGGDFREWARLWTSYLEFYETSVPEDVFISTFERLLSEDPWSPFGLVLSDGPAEGARLVGLVHFLFHTHCWRLDRVCYLQDLFVDPEHRRSRLGRRLIEGVYAAADDAGAPLVYWMTQDFNHEARKLYDRVGVLTPYVKYSRPS